MVIIGILVCCVIVILATVLGVYFSGVSCPSFGADCSTAPAPSPAPAPAPSPAPAPAPPAGTPSPVAAAPLATPPSSATYRLTPDTVAYRGDSNLGSKTIKTVTGDVNTCKSSCDGTSDCTHFERMGNSCTLYRGAEWVGGMPGGQSYCKAQCQQ
jgi:hypothetical protein